MKFTIFNSDSQRSRVFRSSNQTRQDKARERESKDSIRLASFQIGQEGIEVFRTG